MIMELNSAIHGANGQVSREKRRSGDKFMCIQSNSEINIYVTAMKNMSTNMSLYVYRFFKLPLSSKSCFGMGYTTSRAVSCVDAHVLFSVRCILFREDPMHKHGHMSKDVESFDLAFGKNARVYTNHGLYMHAAVCICKMFSG